MEQEMKDKPLHIINGFQLNEHTTKLFAYALDLVRLGANIDESFWIDRIVADDYKAEITDLLSITGPRISRRHFDLFETLETCRRNAHIILEALIDGMSTICTELEEAFMAEDGGTPLIRRAKQNMFRNETIQYLLRPAEEKDIHNCPTYRKIAAGLYDAEPVLLAIRGNSSETKYVWNGEWRALLGVSEADRQVHYRRWYYNHALTIHRLRDMITCHLYTVYADHFSRGKNAGH
ncbi:hypothetical protein pEaSNUABM28_00029 [Erwinia phage pEa_SNUABM_28]|nr:hypothetical protein pEaSNUABM28_00029 [Erwinia phage pEa_SNUABM_28]